MTLNEENIKLLSYKDLPEDLLGKLNYLELCFEDDDSEDDDSEEDTLPFDFLHKVHNLEHLVVRRLGIKEIFQEHQVKERIPTTLKILTLANLEKLKSLGLEHLPYSEKLEILNLKRCPRLQNLVPNSVSFISLKQLCVKLCKKMKYLFKFSTAKSLVQLESLIVMNCKSLKEIAKKEDNDDEIIFGQLTTLRLDSLPKLEGFYFGKATLQFSCLKEVKIAECPKMDKFSIGVAKAPMILHVNFQNNPSLINDDDLNNIIDRLFHKEVRNLLPKFKT